MTMATGQLTDRERELGAIIDAYNGVTEELKRSHDQLRREVNRLHQELARKNAELRRRERLAALGEMAAGVAHEIRNPLGGIQVFASLLARDVSDRPAELQLVEKITRCVGSLEAIVADILDFGRPSEPNPTMIELGPLVAEVVELAVSRTRQAELVVDVAPDVDDVALEIDAALLQRALLNLVVNAMEASASSGGGRVRIDAVQDGGDRVAVCITDEGPGIPPDELERIFNPFFTTKDNGTGLGLAIVHQIAETLGGSVQGHYGPDRGAVFTLQVPVRPVETERELVPATWVAAPKEEVA